MTTAQETTGSTVLITGASSGVGEALARCFARKGHRLVLVARAAKTSSRRWRRRWPANSV